MAFDSGCTDTLHTHGVGSDVAGAVLVAAGANPERQFCRSLARRGLSGVQLVISDAHEGLCSALSQVFASSPAGRADRRAAAGPRLSAGSRG